MLTIGVSGKKGKEKTFPNYFDKMTKKTKIGLIQLKISKNIELNLKNAISKILNEAPTRRQGKTVIEYQQGGESLAADTTISGEFGIQIIGILLIVLVIGSFLAKLGIKPKAQKEAAESVIKNSKPVLQKIKDFLPSFKKRSKSSDANLDDSLMSVDAQGMDFDSLAIDPRDSDGLSPIRKSPDPVDVSRSPSSIDPDSIMRYKESDEYINFFGSFFDDLDNVSKMTPDDGLRFINIEVNSLQRAISKIENQIDVTNDLVKREALIDALEEADEVMEMLLDIQKIAIDNAR